MKQIAFVTDSTNPTLSTSDALIAQAASRYEYACIATPWDDPNIPWSNYTAIIMRSCWNYHLKYELFLTWLTHIEQLHIPIYNHPDVLRWNTHKSYLIDLSAKGIPTIPSVLIKKRTPMQLAQIATSRGWREFVIKPCVGAQAYRIERKHLPNRHWFERFFPARTQTQTDMLVQPFMDEILKNGEYSFVFLGNKYSHAVIKKPKIHDYRTQSMFGGTICSIKPNKSLITQATAILAAAQKNTLYARVDGVVQNTTLLLMELELTEPHLYIEHYPPAADMFALELHKKL